MALADARMAIEGLLPGISRESDPDACRYVDQGGFIRDGPAVGKLCRPYLGSAAGKYLARGRCWIKRIPSSQNFVHCAYYSVTSRPDAFEANPSSLYIASPRR